MFLDISFGENSHPNVITNGPFGNIAIGTTAVISKAPNSTRLCRIDELDGWVRKCRPSRLVETHLVLLQHHEVKVSYAIFRVIPHTFLERNRIDHIADVLVNESVSAQKVSTADELSPVIAYLAKSSSARKPYPFFSVRTISILAYSFRWNLRKTIEGKCQIF